MPSLRYRTSATTNDALSGRKFKVVPLRGAILNLWAAAVTATDSFGLAIGNNEIMVNTSVMNIEASADVVDYDRDWLVMNELVGPGELFHPVTVTTECQTLLNIRYL